MPLYPNPRLRPQFVWFAAAVIFPVAGHPQATAVSQLPPTAPTAAYGQTAPIVATPIVSSENVRRHRARVIYQAGLLEIQANNSSLNGILLDISRTTGMRIVGGVGEQRVFGNYGPATPAVVLETLLDGTGSNMLLKENAEDGPSELVLSPRNGGATPPSPSAADIDSDGDQNAGVSQQVSQSQQQPVQTVRSQNNQAVNAQGYGTQQPSQTSGPQPIPQPWNNVLGSPNNTTPTASSIPTVHSISTDALPTPSTAQPVSGIVDSTNPPPPGSTGFGSMTPTEPAVNAPKTPEQIMQQLQALQAQQQGASQQSGTTSTAPASTTPPQ